jgi:hypothetical protein
MGIRTASAHREPLARVCSIGLCGEQAAWSIRADLALKLDETNAKIAASSQVFDEARHVYVLRDVHLAGGARVAAARRLQPQAPGLTARHQHFAVQARGHAADG